MGAGQRQGTEPGRPTEGLEAALQSLSKQLLDVGKRNRLISCPVGKPGAKHLDIVDELSDEVFRILLRRGRKMSFEPFRGAVPVADTGEDNDMGVFLPDEYRSGTPAAHHVDTKLQSALGPKPLQRRLLSLYREARSIEEEQGVNVLFLALGFLNWFESESSDKGRWAPLILLPVDLERDSSRSGFKVFVRDQDMEPNLSLRELLNTDFGFRLPDLPDGEEWLPSAYCDLAGSAVSSMERWRVEPNLMQIGFFSFAKFQMWSDLSAFTKADSSCLLAKLLTEGFDTSESISTSDENLDQRFPDPRELGHILDADASQTKVIAAAQEGRSLVVQGPPGTGKSQTIANIIAAAAGRGKTVLFVAEKRAALDVVHDRLVHCGLGPICLELHSHKSVRKHVYSELKKTLELASPEAVGAEHYERLRQVRDDLNRTADLLHTVDADSGETPFGVIGRLSRLAARKVPHPGFEIAGSDGWSRREYEDCVAAIEAMTTLIREYGREQDHPWRGLSKRISPIERQRLQSQIELLSEKLRIAEAAGSKGSRVVADSSLGQPAAVERVAAGLEALVEMPQAVPELLVADVLVQRPKQVLCLCEAVEQLQGMLADLQRSVSPTALDIRWDEVRLDIAAHGESLLRFLNGRYRSAMARLKAVQVGDLPATHEGRLEQIDSILACQKMRREVESADQLGREALRFEWRSAETRVGTVLPGLRWIAAQTELLGTGLAVRERVAALPDRSDLVALAGEVRIACDELGAAWKAVAAELALDVPMAFGVEQISEASFTTLQERCRKWTADMGGVESWHRLATSGSRLTELGLGTVRERFGTGALGLDQAAEAFEFVRAASLWKRMCSDAPELESLDGRERTSRVAEFQDLDQKLQRLAAQEVAIKHFAGLPPGSAGQAGIVRGEASKKARHMPIRRLLDRAAEAVMAIKPVFLMSPLSIAQYLKPGRITFDLLLIDEASQVRPADAIGAIQRAKQIVVVGDQKQMPPTSFFDRQVSESGDDSDSDDLADIQAGQVGDMESILSLCEARGMTGARLRWHYRSRHPSLIQVSNFEFYDDKLICPPSPEQGGSELGLSLSFVEGEYHRGKKRNNPKEADAVASAILEHARTRPDESLGVVALSVSQRDAIQDAVELLRVEHPGLEAFCKEGRHESFFVKNLENVQGDERDVVYISVGYGKGPDGYMSQSFGPVSRDGGERRLNVLFTRAKKRCRVFSSIRHSDIRTDATRHRGPLVLKRFLKFAETGELDVPVITGAPMDSPFEESVAMALASHNHRVEPQVGSAGFKIDLAVYDPDDDSRFLLAVECDGARYHSSSWARERDRLRQSVLETKGWKFHRIWSTDWFYNQDEEMEKLLTAIDRARDSGRSMRTAPPVESEEPVIRRTETKPQPEPTHVVPYVEASFSISKSVRRDHLHEVETSQLLPYIRRIVDEEGPIHVDELGRRLSRLWGYKRTGSRILRATNDAATLAVRQKSVQEGSGTSREFLEPFGFEGVEQVRDRSDVQSSKLRDLAMLPPSEVARAIVLAVERNFGIEVDDCAIEVARMLGFKSTSAAMKALVASQVQGMIPSGQLVLDQDLLRLPQPAASVDDELH